MLHIYLSGGPEKLHFEYPDTHEVTKNKSEMKKFLKAVARSAKVKIDFDSRSSKDTDWVVYPDKASGASDTSSRYETPSRSVTEFVKTILKTSVGDLKDIVPQEERSKNKKSRSKSKSYSRKSRKGTTKSSKSRSSSTRKNSKSRSSSRSESSQSRRGSSTSRSKSRPRSKSKARRKSTNKSRS